jgi:hypothetical protein
MADGALLWAYGVVAGTWASPAPLSGIEGGRVEPVRRGELAVLASPAAGDVHRRLAEGAAASVLVAPQDRRLSGRAAEMMLNGAYLVARADAADFARLVEQQHQRHADDGLELELTGPWPPYNFVSAVS